MRRPLTVTQLMLALLLVASSVTRSVAYPGRTEPGSVFVTGDGSLYYHKGTTMVGPLGVFVVIFAALVQDEEEGEVDTDVWEGHDHYHYCCDSGGRMRFPFEALQVGSSAGVFVDQCVAIGLRAVAQDNDEEDAVSSFYGAGPELSWYPGNPMIPLRPFMSISALYVRGAIADAHHERLVSGPSYQVRTGLSWFGPAGGLYVQASRQTMPTSKRHDLPHTRSGWGAGMGVMLYLD